MSQFEKEVLDKLDKWSRQMVITRIEAAYNEGAEIRLGRIYREDDLLVLRAHPFKWFVDKSLIYTAVGLTSGISFLVGAWLAFAGCS